MIDMQYIEKISHHSKKENRRTWNCSSRPHPGYWRNTIVTTISLGGAGG
jgi:hypothetical protein